MKDFDYNDKYIFISDGTWFDKGTECTVEDGNSLWRTYKVEGNWSKNEITYDEMIEHPIDISGIFHGIRTCENPASEGSWKKVGMKYEDGECCTLTEFEIKKKE